MLLSYWVLNRPINEQVAMWTIANLPSDWRQPHVLAATIIHAAA
jgi:hypothetical protein